jgi:prepilin-type N-terminal cleavage/methylation domain-containing protein
MTGTRGFTLIELLVVLAIVAFLAFVTVPLASGWIRNAQLEKDFAGIQRALGTTKALAMRNLNNAKVGVATAVLCLSGVQLIVYQSEVPAGAAASCARIDPIAANNKPLYSLGQDVTITFGATNQAFCGAQFDARGTMRLCQGANCATCDITFNPDTNGGLKVQINGADTNLDDAHDQSQFIRAF